jgi:hypothetical protein
MPVSTQETGKTWTIPSTRLETGTSTTVLPSLWAESPIYPEQYPAEKLRKMREEDPWDLLGTVPEQALRRPTW